MEAAEGWRSLLVGNRPLHSKTGGSVKTPYFWKGMSFTAKAGYLCATKQARDYSHACSLLAARKRKPKARKQEVVYWWEDGNGAAQTRRT